MRIFIACVASESNTNAPFPTGRRTFEEGGLYRTDASRIGTGLLGAAAKSMRESIESQGHEVVESLFAIAQPSGPTLQPLWEEFRDIILDDLVAQPVDAVFLLLHGAMVTFDCDDCEGDLLTRIRAQVGPRVPVGAMLDPHCHLTEAMCSKADVLVAMKEYPHSDGLERLSEVLHLLIRQARGEIRPTTAVFDCRMIGFYPTTIEPMRSYVRRLTEVEGRPGVLSASLAHGFPWGDVQDVGTRVWVITNDDPALASATAAELGQILYGMRESLRPSIKSLDEALAALPAASGLTVWADVGDNPGGGAPGDNTAILRALIDKGLKSVALGLLWDPVSTAVCHEAGVGATLDLRLGGKCGPSSGVAVDARVVVRGLLRGFKQPALLSDQAAGDIAWVSIDGIDVVMNSIRCQTLAPEVFTDVGIPLAHIRLAVVKSSHHFHERFSPLARHIEHVAAGGALNMDFASFEFQHRDALWWPRVSNPLGIS